MLQIECLSPGCSVRTHEGGRQRGHAEARRGLSQPRFFAATRLSPSVGRRSRGLHVRRHPVPPSASLCWCGRSEPSAYLSSSNPGLWDLSGPRHNYPRCPLGPRLFLLLSLSFFLPFFPSVFLFSFHNLKSSTSLIIKKPLQPSVTLPVSVRCRTRQRFTFSSPSIFSLPPSLPPSLALAAGRCS